MRSSRVSDRARRKQLRAEAVSAPSAAVRRRTRLLAAIGGSGGLVLLSAEMLRVWRLGMLPVTRGDRVEAWSPRLVAQVVREGYRVSTTRENTLFNMVTSFMGTFAIARSITYGIRVRGRLGPIRNLKTAGGRHIHHFLPGMVLSMGAGGWSVASQNQEIDRWLAIPFGIGTALVVDEAALLLELEDVYWSEEGLLSVQVAFATLGLLAALAHLNRVRRRDEPSLEADWQAAARAFDHLQMIPGSGRRGEAPAGGSLQAEDQ